MLFRSQSARALLAATATVLGLHWSVFQSEPPFSRIAFDRLTAVASLLSIGAVFQDGLAHLCRRLAAPMLVATTLSGLTLALEMGDGFTWAQVTFVMGMVGISWWYARMIKLSDCLIAGLCNLGIGVIVFGWQLTLLLQRDFAWKGAVAFMLGLLWLLIAVLISSWKAGWLTAGFRRLRVLLQMDRTISST